MAISRAVFGTQLVALCILAGTSRAQQPAQAGVPDSARRDSTPSALIGRVVDSAGVGVPGAEITLSKSDKVHVITGDSGEFRITGLPPGTLVFNVRRIGFESASFTAVLKPGKMHRATFPMTA
ncbi:MAG TPA: carboxypeptidase-like regulatory domain-containing protein, partial [Gemmatimonadaceae bacterium]